jgi:glycosyltransferase involved in cell wall biosynthesis
MNINESVSIIICCYNSVSRLKPTLEHIAKQQVDINITWEVIIIDNNSSDGTGEYATKIWQNLNCSVSFQIVEESNPGLSNARKKGIEVSKYNYIIFCDDDNWLCNSYVKGIYEIFNTNKQIGIIGCQNEPVSQNPLPKWFNEVQVYYAVGALYPKSEEFENINKGVFGAGMALRKTAYLELIKKEFNFNLADRKGKDLSSGGDLELRIVLGLIGYTCYYSKELSLQHFIPIERINKKYVKKLAFEWGKVVFLLSTYHHHVKKRPNLISFYILWSLKNYFTIFFTLLIVPLKGFSGYCNLITRIGIAYGQLTNSKMYFDLRKKHIHLFPNNNTSK